MRNHRYQPGHIFSISLLAMSLFLMGASMKAPTPDAVIWSDDVDLELTKECTDAGDGTALIHLTVVNNGGSTATNVRVAEFLPDFTTIEFADPDQGTYDEDTDIWDVGSLGEGDVASLILGVSVTEQGEYENFAFVVADQRDDDESDNEAECTYVVADRGTPDFVPEQSPGGVTDRGNRFAADLAVSKDVEVDGSSAIYTIMVENFGPQSTSKVRVTESMPDCLEFDGLDVERGSYDPDTGFWDVGAVKVGEKVTLEITATITDACTGTVTNTVSISRSSLPEPSTPFLLPFGSGTNPRAENNHAEASFDAGSGRVLDGEVFVLGRNYPNPFNPTTVVPFSVAEASHVSLRVYDLLGREVKVLVDGRLSAGVHEVTFEASTLPTGVYLIRMEAAGFVQIQRVTLMK